MYIDMSVLMCVLVWVPFLRGQRRMVREWPKGFPPCSPETENFNFFNFNF